MYELVVAHDQPRTAASLYYGALLCNARDKYELAEPLFQQALAIREKSLGADHPHVAIVLKEYAILLWKTNRQEEAKQLMSRAKTIWAMHPQEKPALDEEEPSTVPVLPPATILTLSN